MEKSNKKTQKRKKQNYLKIQKEVIIENKKCLNLQYTNIIIGDKFFISKNIKEHKKQRKEKR